MTSTKENTQISSRAVEDQRLRWNVVVIIQMIPPIIFVSMVEPVRFLFRVRLSSPLMEWHSQRKMSSYRPIPMSSFAAPCSCVEVVGGWASDYMHAQRGFSVDGWWMDIVSRMWTYPPVTLVCRSNRNLLGGLKRRVQ